MLDSTQAIDYSSVTQDVSSPLGMCTMPVEHVRESEVKSLHTPPVRGIQDREQRSPALICIRRKVSVVELCCQRHVRWFDSTSSSRENTLTSKSDPING